jgi:hypothetical protein
MRPRRERRRDGVDWVKRESAREKDKEGVEGESGTVGG